MKKQYKSPRLRTERVEIGVFGCYGSSGLPISEGGVFGIFFGILNPLFRLCCGG